LGDRVDDLFPYMFIGKGEIYIYGIYINISDLYGDAGGFKRKKSWFKF